MMHLREFMFGDRMGEIVAIPVAIYKVVYSNASKLFMLEASSINFCFGHGVCTS
jgi:hypothetical protein